MLVAGLVGSGWISGAIGSAAAEDADIPVDIGLADVGAGVVDEAGGQQDGQLTLVTGELRTVVVEGLERVAIGDPKVADVSIPSETEVLVQGKGAGTTSLIIWDRSGIRTFGVSVQGIERKGQVEELEHLVRDLDLTEVWVKTEGANVFLMGRVKNDRQQEQLEEILDTYEGIRSLVAMVPDAPEAEQAPTLVELSVQVLEVARSDLERIGVKWNESITLTENAIPSGSITDTILRIGEKVSRDSFRTQINALVQQNRARVLAEPKLVTASGKEANSFMGGEVPILTTTTTGISTGVVSTSIQFKSVGVELEMKPIVLEGDEVVKIELMAEVSTIDPSTAITVQANPTVTVPGFKVRRAETEVAAGPGDTVIIAGLLQSEDSEAISQVPALGSVPVFGRLFRSPEFQTRQTELIITITPDVLYVSGERVSERQKAPSGSDAADTGDTGGEPPSDDEGGAEAPGADTAGVRGLPEDPVLRYAMTIRDHLARRIAYPEDAERLDVAATLMLHVGADGSLRSAEMSDPTGVAALDDAVLDAVKDEPFPPFPDGMPQEDLWLELPIVFQF